MVAIHLVLIFGFSQLPQLLKAGKLVIPCKWYRISSFGGGKASVYDENYHSFTIDKAGNIIEDSLFLKIEDYQTMSDEYRLHLGN